MSAPAMVDADAIRSVLRIEDLIEPVAHAFAAYSRGEADAPLMVLQPRDDGDVHIKAAALRGHALYTVKIASWFAPRLLRGLSPLGGFIAAFDAELGDLRALLFDDHLISDLRTAAAGAVAARWLAPEDVTTVGVIGTGMQARLQVEALALVRHFSRVVVWGRTSERAEATAAALRAALPHVTVRIEAELARVVQSVDVLITATGSRAPLVRGEWLKPGQHVTAVGADDATKCELDASCLRRADRVIVDSRAANEGYGDVHAAIASGALEASVMSAELGEVVAGTSAGRGDRAEITIAKLVGLGVQDLVAAEWVLERLGLFSAASHRD